MTAADLTDSEYAHEHPDRPSPRDDNPAAAVPFRLVEHDVGDDAASEDDEDRSPDDFRDVRVHLPLRRLLLLVLPVRSELSPIFVVSDLIIDEHLLIY
ncbi:hypothetical protein BN903_5 [Halorubrum sp. AJ67]|nr:hypothetical protein BN903_5 [Halorubrum sp. AJ67]